MSTVDQMAYAGDLSVKDAYEGLRTDPNSVLVDVRTQPEWIYVGMPSLAALNKKPIFREWQIYPSMQIDPRFVEELDAALRARGVAPDTPIYFLCRSGARSRSAAIAATEAGWRRCYNIVEGFEGPRDTAGRRGTTSGWKVAGLPWTQS